MRASARLPILCIASLTWALLLPSRAAPAADSITATVDRDHSLLQIRSTILASAPASTCYAVLADFNRLPEYVPDLKSSRIVSAPGEPVRLHQVGVASVALFKVTLDVTLNVKEIPPRRLEFDRVAGNLRQMRGSWNVTGDGGHCEIQYDAEIEPAFWVPPLIGPRLMQGQVVDQMQGLLAEIERRAGTAHDTQR
jgi:ribosome-associated toxin RatA of RatAB toxin-antitoxin module